MYWTVPAVIFAGICTLSLLVGIRLAKQELRHGREPICRLCGCRVADRNLHAKWHAYFRPPTVGQATTPLENAFRIIGEAGDHWEDSAHRHPSTGWHADRASTKFPFRVE